jgi:hypothetical protein
MNCTDSSLLSANVLYRIQLLVLDLDPAIDLDVDHRRHRRQERRHRHLRFCWNRNFPSLIHLHVF